ncbi:PIN domain nuclease [Microbacterium sp.]|uniref:PIN domain nuclease n=1 Tax=Microbacterium sp. TaxID=51671 RepID=UPI0039E61678
MTSWLIDKSALARMGSARDAELWFSRVERGLVQIATPTLLEVGYSALNRVDWESKLRRPPVHLMPLAILTPRAEARALDVQAELATHGQHRAPSVADLLIAVIAEEWGLTVLHVDKDFEMIAKITGQPVERLAL